jgi:uncharacterized membrane protein
VAILLAAPFFAFYGAGLRSLWLDEAYSALLARMDFHAFLTEAKNDSGPPLYYLLLKVWISAFGLGESALRSLSGLFYLGMLAWIYRAARHLTPARGVALFCTALCVFSPLAFRHAQSVRMYALSAMWAAGSIWAFIDLMRTDRPRSRQWVIYALINSLGCLTHYWFWFVLLGQAFAYLLFWTRRIAPRFIAAYLSGLVPFIALWSPFVLHQKSSGVSLWLSPPGGAELLDTFLDLYGGGKGAAILLLGLIGLTLVGARRPLPEPEPERARRLRWAMLIILATTVGVPFLLSQFKPMYLVGRYTVVLVPGFALCLAAWMRSAPRPAWILPLLGISLLGAGSAAFVRHRLAPPTESDRATARVLEDRIRPGDALLFTSLSVSAIEYYFVLDQWNLPIIRAYFPLEVGLHPSWRNYPALLGDPARVEEEARAVVSNLKERLKGKPDASIWVLAGADPEILPPLLSELRRNFAHLETIDQGGAFHKEILHYAPRSPAR